MTHWPRQRLWIGAIGLLGSAWLAFFGDKTPSGTAQPVSRPVLANKPQPASPTVRPAEQARRSTPELQDLVPRAQTIRRSPLTSVDIFSTRNWTPPPPPIVAEPVPVPVAPAVPYIYIGKKQESGLWEVYLSRNDTTYVARRGVTLEGTYLVERVEPPTVILKYLPLNQLQSLAIGE